MYDLCECLKNKMQQIRIKKVLNNHKSQNLKYP